MQAAQALLPYLCQLTASLGKLASSAAMAIGVLLRACYMDPPDWIPSVNQHLHIVQALAQAYIRRSAAVQQQQQQAHSHNMHHQHQLPTMTTAPAQQLSEHQQSEGAETRQAELEGTVEGSLLMLIQHFAQSTAGAHMLLEQGLAALLPQLAKWLLSPAGGGLPCHFKCNTLRVWYWSSLHQCANHC